MRLEDGTGRKMVLLLCRELRKLLKCRQLGVGAEEEEGGEEEEEEEHTVIGIGIRMMLVPHLTGARHPFVMRRIPCLHLESSTERQCISLGTPILLPLRCLSFSVSVSLSVCPSLPPFPLSSLRARHLVKVEKHGRCHG